MVRRSSVSTPCLHGEKRPSLPTANARLSHGPAFTSAFKELDQIPQFRATAKLGVLGGPVLQFVLAYGARQAARASCVSQKTVTRVTDKL
jgi:hypothetical protein